MFKIWFALGILSLSLLSAQELAPVVRVSNPSVPTSNLVKPVSKVSGALFGEQANKAPVITDSPEKTEAREPSPDPVQVALPALDPLPGEEDASDPLTLFNQLSPLPITNDLSEPLKKKVNGKYVITSKRDSSTKFEVREVNGRKVIYPK